jgi:hypothetical protein
VFSRRETHRTLGEREIFGDEVVAELLTEIEQLRSAVTDIRHRVDAQLTTTAAHAEISRQQIELARNESRADLDRTRETLIGLIEQVRAERGEFHVAGSAPGVSPSAVEERLDTFEIQIAGLASTVERCLARQNELADTMAAFLDTVLAEQRGEPVAGLSLS